MWVFFAVYVQQKGKHPQIYFLLKKRRYVVIVVCITQSSAALLFLVPTLFQRKYFLCPSAFLSHKGAKTAVMLNPIVLKCFLRPPATLSPMNVIVPGITQSSAALLFLIPLFFQRKYFLCLSALLLPGTVRKRAVILSRAKNLSVQRNPRQAIRMVKPWDT